jgi:hypothetical protein
VRHDAGTSGARQGSQGGREIEARAGHGGPTGLGGGGYCFGLSPIRTVTFLIYSNFQN